MKPQSTHDKKPIQLLFNLRNVFIVVNRLKSPTGRLNAFSDVSFLWA